MRRTQPQLRHDHLSRRQVTDTLIAGTRLSGQIRLTHATPVEFAMLADILEHFATTEHLLGGRTAAGHGRIHATYTSTVAAGTSATDLDWRGVVAAGRVDAIGAPSNLT